ncbi:MAG: MFS transporter, partial [Gorillibacterium sp.]|nr:MFS transporter [Gorillibacterium sp.]
RWLGARLTTLLALGTMALSGICMYLSFNYPTLSAAYFLLYVGNGMLEIALAILAARIFTKNTGTMMNLSHFFYGLSSTIAPLLASRLMSISIGGNLLGWRGMYLIVLLAAVLPMIPTLLAKIPKVEEVAGERTSFKEYLQDPIAWLIVGILSFGVVSELAVGGWLVNYMEKVYAWDTTSASSMLSAFFLCFMLARLVLGPLTDRYGYVRSMAAFSLFSGLCSLAAIAAGESGAFLFAVAGIGIAPIYPTVMALLSKRYLHNSDTAITFTVTLMGLASVFGNYLIGAITDWTKNAFDHSAIHPTTGLIHGLQAGYSFIAGCALLCSCLCIVLYYQLKKRHEVL